MVLSASRRTDIPAFYPEWFMNRLREGFVCVRNPMNYHQISRVSLDKSLVDCIVFWTKNAKPLLRHMDEIKKDYAFYFQYTLNAYERDMETALPPLEDRLDTFARLSGMTSAKQMIWRYDPVLLSDKYTIKLHTERFEHLASALNGKTNTCVFSFIDIYDKVKNNIKSSNIRACTPEEMNLLAEAFSKAAARNGIELRTCAEQIDLDRYGIKHGCCIDCGLISELTGCDIKAKKDPNQRTECGCLESIDIGQYNTCRHGCRYCYANFNPQSVVTFSRQHDVNSSVLIGSIESGDKVTDRKTASLKKAKNHEEQLSFL